MRVYYIVQDASAVKQTDAQREAHLSQWQTQPFGDTIRQRHSGPNEQLTLGKRSVTGEFWLGGVDVEDAAVRAMLDREARKIDGRFTQVQRQLALVLLAELRAALPPDDASRADQLAVEAVAWGDRDTAIADVQAYLRTNAAVWYGN